MSQPSDAVDVRPASSVMLLRDTAAGLEVFTLQRVAQMVFAAGMTVFPGGGAEPSDADESVPWTGPGAEWWARAFRVDETTARAAVVAAARELFEETGVLLATDATGAPAADAVQAWMTVRESLACKHMGLAPVLREGAWTLRADLLRPWARWITPPGPPRRYDTFFFLAKAPEGSNPDWATSEAAGGSWRRPAELLEAGRTGKATLMPPTIAMLSDLAAADSVDCLLAEQRMVDVVSPLRVRS